MSVKIASYKLSELLYQRKGTNLSVGTMICGFTGKEPQIWYVDSEGSRVKSTHFAVGSGGNMAYGVLMSDYKYEMTKEEGLELGRKIIFFAAHSDAYSGGVVNQYFISEDGFEKIGTFDIDSLAKVYLGKKD